MSSSKTFFEWCVPSFSGHSKVKELKWAYFSSILLNNFLGACSEPCVSWGFPGDSQGSCLAQRALRNGTQAEYPSVAFLLHSLSAYFSARSALNLGVRNVESRMPNVEFPNGFSHRVVCDHCPDKALIILRRDASRSSN